MRNLLVVANCFGILHMYVKILFSFELGICSKSHVCILLSIYIAGLCPFPLIDNLIWFHMPEVQCMRK